MFPVVAICRPLSVPAAELAVSTARPVDDENVACRFPLLAITLLVAVSWPVLSVAAVRAVVLMLFCVNRAETESFTRSDKPVADVCSVVLIEAVLDANRSEAYWAPGKTTLASPCEALTASAGPAPLLGTETTRARTELVRSESAQNMTLVDSSGSAQCSARQRDPNDVPLNRSWCDPWAASSFTGCGAAYNDTARVGGGFEQD